jgi:hypothetical protein
LIIRYWAGPKTIIPYYRCLAPILLIRMLYWPALSPLSASKRLPGGALKKSRVAAAFSWVSFRSATRRMVCQRWGQRPSNRAWVSLPRKLLIIGFIIYRYSIYYKSVGGLTQPIPPVSLLPATSSRKFRLTSLHKIGIFQSTIHRVETKNISSVDEDEAGCSFILVSEGNVREI